MKSEMTCAHSCGFSIVGKWPVLDMVFSSKSEILPFKRWAASGKKVSESSPRKASTGQVIFSA